MTRLSKGNELESVSVEFGGLEMELDVPEGVWRPTPHGRQLGHVLAELRFDGQKVLELGTGCGIHAILLGRNGAREMTLTELDGDVLELARHNLNKNGLGNIEITYEAADWTNVEPDQYDVLVTNPPFCQSGKRYRRYFIDTLILDAHKLVKPGGHLIFIQSSMADIPRSIRLMEENGMSVEILGESSGPFRSYYFDDAAFMKEMAAIPGSYVMIDGVHHERLIVFRATLPG